VEEHLVADKKQARKHALNNGVSRRAGFSVQNVKQLSASNFTELDFSYESDQCWEYLLV
jgi:hypothetical protein